MNIINIGDDDVVRLNGSLMKGSQFKIIYQKVKEAVNKELKNGYSIYHGDLLKDIKFFTMKSDLENCNFTIISNKFEYLKPNGEGWKQAIVKITGKIQCEIIKLNDVEIDNNLEKSENEPKILTFNQKDIINLGNNNLIEGNYFMLEIRRSIERLLFSNYQHDLSKTFKTSKYQELIYQAKAENVIDLLRVNGKAWEKARILEIYITLNIDHYEDIITDYESPLDDIREMIKNGEINCH